jgi:pilus assembly protein CpaF
VNGVQRPAASSLACRIASDDDGALKRRVHERLVTAGRELEADATPAELQARLRELLRSEAPLLAARRHDQLLEELVRDVTGLGPLEPLLADPDVDEIMVNGPGIAYVERRGTLERVPLPLDADAIVRLVGRVIAPLGLRLDRASPMVDARLPDGSRLHAVVPPLAIDGPCMTIRRFRAQSVPLEAFGLDAGGTRLMRWMVDAGWNVIVAGGTSTGKTTLLNALSAAIPAHERVVTIEETAELRLARPHVVRLEARRANAEGAGEVTVRELVRAALRMRPDRIVVGEVRGGEALDMLQAMNTGHDGSLSTLHANSAADALTRLETLVLFAGVGLPTPAIRAQIASAVDAVVHVGRARGGARCVRSVAEVALGRRGVEVRPLLTPGAEGQKWTVQAPSRPPRRPIVDEPEETAP